MDFNLIDIFYAAIGFAALTGFIFVLIKVVRIATTNDADID